MTSFVFSWDSVHLLTWEEETGLRPSNYVSSFDDTDSALQRLERANSTTIVADWKLKNPLELLIPPGTLQRAHRPTTPAPPASRGQHNPLPGSLGNSTCLRWKVVVAMMTPLWISSFSFSFCASFSFSFSFWDRAFRKFQDRLLLSCHCLCVVETM